MELTLRMVGFLATCVGISLIGVELRPGRSATKPPDTYRYFVLRDGRLHPHMPAASCIPANRHKNGCATERKRTQPSLKKLFPKFRQFFVHHLIDLPVCPVDDLLYLVFPAEHVIFRQFLYGFSVLHALHNVVATGPKLNTRGFRRFFDEFRELVPAFIAKRRNRCTDRRTVVRGGKPHMRRFNRLDDRVYGIFVPNRYLDRPRRQYRNGSQLADLQRLIV